MSTLNIKKFIKKHQYLRLGITRTIVLFISQAAGNPAGNEGGGPGNFYLVVAQYPEQLFRIPPGWRDLQAEDTWLFTQLLPGTITRTILRVIPKTREIPNQNTICAWESRSQPDITRTIFRVPDPEAGPSPAGRRKKRGWRADGRPRQAFPLLCCFLIIVCYRILFGFCGIFCGCYVNHAIFSTIHKFLQLFHDLLPTEIIDVFMCYMATGDH